MSETATPAPKGKRRPTDADLELLLALVAEKSLNASCAELGLDTPSTYKWLHEDDKRRQSYASCVHAREDLLAEESLTIAKAGALGIPYQGKKIDANGARVLLDAVKWMSGRMKPKSQQIDVQHSFKDPAARDGRIAELLKRAGGEEARND